MPEELKTPSVQAAVSAEHQQESDKADPFPPEGTDEKVIKPKKEEDEGLSQEVRLAATRAWLKAERERNRKT